MAREPKDYLDDILEAIAAIRTYTRAGKRVFLREAMARDAVVARILQIGEAVKGLQACGTDLGALAPMVPWKQIAGMRDLLSHQYWRTDPEIVWLVATNDLKPLQAATKMISAAYRKKGRVRSR